MQKSQNISKKKYKYMLPLLWSICFLWLLFEPGDEYALLIVAIPGVALSVVFGFILDILKLKMKIYFALFSVIAAFVFWNTLQWNKTEMTVVSYLAFAITVSLYLTSILAIVYCIILKGFTFLQRRINEK